MMHVCPKILIFLVTVREETEGLKKIKTMQVSKTKLCKYFISYKIFSIEVLGLIDRQ